MWLSLVLLAAAVVLLAPAHFEIAIAKDAGTAARVRARLKWLVFSFRIGRAARASTPAKPRRPKAGGRSRFGWRSVYAVLTSRGFAPRVLRLLADFTRLARPDDCRVRARVGFEDPSDTGLLIGGVQAFCNAAGLRQVNLTPDFSGEVVEGRLQFRWSRSLASLLWPVIAFGSSPAVWRALIRGRRAAT